MTWASARSLTLPLAYLRGIGLAPRQQTRTREAGWVEGLLEAYRPYLREERGLGADTRRAYLRVAGAFLSTAKLRSPLVAK